MTRNIRMTARSVVVNLHFLIFSFDDLRQLYCELRNCEHFTGEGVQWDQPALLLLPLPQRRKRHNVELVTLQGCTADWCAALLAISAGDLSCRYAPRSPYWFYSHQSAFLQTMKVDFEDELQLCAFVEEFSRSLPEVQSIGWATMNVEGA